MTTDENQSDVFMIHPEWADYATANVAFRCIDNCFIRLKMCAHSVCSMSGLCFARSCPENGSVRRSSHLRDAVLMGHHPHDVIQRQQGVTLDLCVDVLALGADSQELYQVYVVHQRAVFIHAVPLRSHHLHQRLEGGAVVIEDQNIFACIHQL